jgi:hypothetical protein
MKLQIGAHTKTLQNIIKTKNNRYEKKNYEFFITYVANYMRSIYYIIGYLWKIKTISTKLK